ncbi:MAG: glutamate synthase subunit alpha, partial [Candidatus Omnitrophota bacterium]
MLHRRIPEKQGLYDPQFEHDSCGVGFVCDINGRASYDIVRDGIQVLTRLSHRGATGADPKTGDGAGILIQIPHDFLEKACRRDAGFKLPQKGKYGTGLIFLPTDKKDSAYCKKVLSRIAKEEGQPVIGWRKVPVNPAEIGHTARATQPEMAQVFIQKNDSMPDILTFERSLYIIRKKTENAIRSSKLKQKDFFYITNLSARTLSYKGLLMPGQLGDYFLDLKDPDLKSAIALVHSRYSTNTFPTWDLSQPFRFIAHNGEINTLRGNINWMRAREGLLANGLFGKRVKEILPIIVPGGSDSATLDNVFELLVLSGRSIAHAAMMLIPAAWERDNAMSAKLKDFYRYH